MNDIENIEWIDSLTEVELKGELLKRVKLVETLRRHRDTLLEQLGLSSNACYTGTILEVVSKEEIGTRDRVIGQDAYRIRGIDTIEVEAQNITNLQAGDQVYWRDPDECVASGYGEFIKHVNEEVALIIKDGISLEVFITELSI